ncbi:cytochrome c [Rhodococcus sp. D-46]|nr:c-type cytochrome [Rhodococcus qingshengii]MYV27701.1 c-type cytochrome [Rhodococcus erythropolis]NHE63757.1 cytochrome c [Rhodococcus sp. D-46]MBS3693432.1 c-type cytochrome [Rhodococcus qingshengii]MBT2270369.1 c-type cytochrome [Rhodococcus qingshengii]
MKAGRSQNRACTPFFAAHCSACHSGENTANGQNAAFDGSPVAYASNAIGGSIDSDAASITNGSASEGPSIRTTSGENSSRPCRTERADPGPW